MLRTRVQTRTGSTGVILSVSHGLGTTLEAWNIVELSARGLGRTYHVPGTAAANRICVRNSIQTTVTVEVFCFAYQGRLY